MQPFKKIFLFFFFHLMYWILLGVWARSLFLLFYTHEFQQTEFVAMINCFRYGFRLDLSIACYIVSLSLLCWIIYYLSSIRSLLVSYRVIHLISLLGYTLITIADIAVYRHWNTKINLTALQFAHHPKEVFASIGFGDQPVGWVIAFVLTVITFSWLFYRIQRIIDIPLLNKNIHTVFKSILIFILFISVSVIGMRGGIQLEPVNQSTAYFSDRPIENQAAINASWNLLEKLTSNRGGRNPYHFGTTSEVQEALNTHYHSNPDTTRLFSLNRPNIVFIILEGFTADVIPAFGGESGLTPQIDSLVKSGLIWTNFYANGDRTYKGLPALLNGHPTRPVGSITQDPDLTPSLPSMAKRLNSLGYSSSFYYGGESEFANIKSYLLNTGFDKIIDIKDFPSSYRGIKWGVPDHYVFEKLNQDLSHTPSPFFSCILTLSTHEPYDIPMEPILKSKTWPDLFRNTVYYTDRSLGQFIHTARSQPWYDSTIFILTADHGNPMPKDYPNNFHPGRFKIPLLIFGTPLLQKYKGKVNPRYGTQTDLAYSLLSTLSMPDSSFNYSMNLMDTTDPGSGFYTFDHGFGMVNHKTKFAYDLNGNRLVYVSSTSLHDSIHPTSPSHEMDSLIHLGKLLMQGTYGEKIIK